MQSRPLRFAVFLRAEPLRPNHAPGTPNDILRQARCETFPRLMYQTRYGVNCFARVLLLWTHPSRPGNRAEGVCQSGAIQPCATTFPAKRFAGGCILRTSACNGQRE